MIKNIVIVGGGNIGTLLLSDFAKYEEFEVSLIASDPQNWDSDISVFDVDENLLHVVSPKIITNDLNILLDADLVIFTYPTNIYIDKIKEYIKYIPEGCYVGTMPGLGGKEFFVERDVNYFSFQRVHGVSRIKDRGKSVYDLGKRDHLYLATSPNVDGEFLSDFFTKYLEIQCSVVPNLLGITLTPSNPILHTSRLYGLGQMENNSILEEDYLFYEEWDDYSSEVLITMDTELQNICENLEPLDLSLVKSLLVHYESETVSDLTNKIKSIKAFKGLRSPIVSNEQGQYIFDEESRYFKEDFLYGLIVLYDFGLITQTPTPMMLSVLKWYDSRFNIGLFDDSNNYNKEIIKALPIPSNFGMHNKEDVIKFYSKS